MFGGGGGCGKKIVIARHLQNKNSKKVPIVNLVLNLEESVLGTAKAFVTRWTSSSPVKTPNKDF